MLRGGHFAAAVLKARGASSSAPKSRLDPSSDPFDTVDHKTFHRYVVRSGDSATECQNGNYHTYEGKYYPNLNFSSVTYSLFLEFEDLLNDTIDGAWE